MNEFRTQRRAGIALALMVAAGAMAACGGAGGGSSVPHQQSSGAVNGIAQITIPNATSTSSTTRKAQYVSAAAQSVGVTVNGGPATFTSVATGSSVCTTATTSRTCAIPLVASAGSNTFVFTFYDGANGAGNNLGSGTATQTVTIGIPFTVSVVVNGVPVSVAITVPVIDAGPATVPVTVIAKDAAGNTIIAPGAYSTPITLTNSDTTGTLKLSATTVNTPADVITLAYSGGGLASAATISATVPGLSATAIKPASVLPLNYFPVGLSRSYAFTTSSSSTTVPIGTATPLASSSQPPVLGSGTYNETIAGGATFNGITGAQSIASTGGGAYFIGNSAAANGVSTTAYQVVGSASVALLGISYGNGAGTTPGLTYTGSGGFVYAALPFVTGATATAAPPFTFLIFGETLTADSNGNQTTTLPATATSDGSAVVFVTNADGSGTSTYTAGTGTCSVTWSLGLPCSVTKGTGSVTAPTAGGTMTETVSQTTAGGTQTGSLTVPVSSLYPAGIPKTYSVTSTVGAPIAAPPSTCIVTAPFQGPIVPITIVQTFASAVGPGVTTTTEIDYLAPSSGPICKTYATTSVNYVTLTMQSGGVQVFNSFGDGTSVLPLVAPNYQLVSSYSETDSQVPTTQSGTVTPTGNARSVSGAMRMGSPFLIQRMQAQGNVR